MKAILLIYLQSKKSKNGAGRAYSYFDLTIQTEKNKLRAVCLPDKHKYFKSNASSEMEDVESAHNTTDLFINLYTIIKEQKVSFDKDNSLKTTSIDSIVIEMAI